MAKLLRGRRSTVTPPAPPPRRDVGLWLVVTAALTLAPHAAYLPPWIAALCTALLIWRTAALLRQHRSLPAAILLLMAVGAGFAVRQHFGHFFGQEPGVALLALLLCLKLFELRTLRDVRVAVMLSFFLQLGLFFDNETLPVAALALAGALCALACLVAAEDAHSHTRERLRTAGVLLAQSLPLMAVLFLLFPRIPAPLWGLPADANSASSGLSDAMSPGSISSLGLSEEIAFRVEFLGAVPEPRLRYWRGPVLTEFDGRTWRPIARPTRDQPGYQLTGPRIDYRMTLEPHGQRWLLALDFPGADLAQVRYTPEFQAVLRAPLRDRTQFALTAHPGARVGLQDGGPLLEAALQLPPGNARSRALARELAGDTPNAERTIARTLDYLRGGHFLYTLEPPLLKQDFIDEFLFDTRQGYCEHFSAAFVFLLRAAGVPARVVAGYQGGELNPFDGTLIVRQSDAHAWAEAWIADKGWVRVDPTAAVAPSRISGESAARSATGGALPLMMQTRLDWLRQLRLRWEAVSHGWDLWVLGYNSERQADLLRRLGLSQTDWTVLAGVGSLAGLAFFALLFIWAQWRSNPADALDRAWGRFCGKLAKAGVPRHPFEGPLDYCTRAGAARPAERERIDRISRTYARLRYGRDCPPDQLRALQHDIDSLRIK
ncbi:hypothetical protein dqs_1202 [Azoarcus olearius]|uniref:transglutaminase TgpA family protein n=1 Tax=Azoarcus sp. (strain BH72) TaxID=418699 RepID=UPI0008060948|nr:DUF3488 and transglutaminase-like domain-containing protein [Azoarcus olearius]ANQ84257.1 hypothetical protein dqs_1202 [Azoarcus olearius]